MKLSSFCLRSIGFIIWLGCHANLHGQNRNFSFQNFNIENGLSYNHVSNIFQDSRGFLWVSSNEGLNRFDGLTFKVFYQRKGDPHSLPFNGTSSIVEYQAGRLLLVSGLMLTTFDTWNDLFYPPKDTILRSAVALHLFREKNGQIWICTPHQLILIDSGLNLLRTYDCELPRSVMRDHNGKIAVCTSSGLYYMDEKSGAFTSFKAIYDPDLLPTSPLGAKYDELSHSIFAFTWDSGMYVIHTDSLRVDRYFARPGCTSCLPSNGVRDALSDTAGNIWMATLNGLVLINPGDKKAQSWQHYPDDPSSLTGSNLQCIYEDKFKNLWIGSSEGLSKLSNRSQSIQYFKNELKIGGRNAEIYDITKSDDGKIYVATYGNGVFEIDFDSGTVKNEGKNIISYAWSVNPVNNNLIVTGHKQFIYGIQPEGNRIFEIQDLKPFYGNCDLVLFAFQASNGDRWYSINMGQGLVRFKAKERRYIHYHNRLIPQPFDFSYFNAVTEDEWGNLWFGVNKRLELIKWNVKTEMFEKITTNEIPGVDIKRMNGLNALLADHRGSVWIGTDGSGLIRYDIKAGKGKLFSIEDGLLSNNIASLLEDNKQRLWVGTRKGLSCFLTAGGEFINLTSTDGLPENYFNDGVSYYDTAKNEIYLGTRFSVIKIYPDQLLASTNARIPVYLDGLKVNDKKQILVPGERPLLPYYANNLQFYFTVVNYDNPGDIQLQYKLEGIDKDWKFVDKQRSALYLNIPQGKYQFHVRAKNNASKSWSYLLSPLYFEVRPPFWNTWWFGILLLAAGSASILIIARTYYRRKFEKQRIAFEKQQAVEQERNRIATDMHDDLGAGLTRIKFITENIADQFREIKPEEVKNLRASANELMEKMGEIIWAMNEKNNSLEDLVFYLRSYAVTYCQENNIECIFEIPEAIPQIIISGNMRRNIFLLLKECLHNVVKHSGATNVSIKVHLDMQFELSIHDNGRGINLSQIETGGNGMINMRKRVNEMHGKFEALNQAGTTIRIAIPLLA